jgi:hypothetical protein
MSPMDWGVVVAGIAAIGWVNWYFFLAGNRGVAAKKVTPRRGSHGSGGGRDVSNDAKHRGD